MNARRPRFWQGIVFFFAVIAILLFGCAPLQYYFGLVGVALTEVILLAAALTAALICRCDLNEVFVFRLVPPRKLTGAIVMYFGTYLFILPMMTLLAEFFPRLYDIGDQLADIGTEMTPAAAILIMAALPAVCEEAVFRGFLMSSCRNWLQKPNGRLLISLTVGIAFGVFHTDVLRFPQTMLLGMIFTYVDLVCVSILPSMLLHFINNMISVVSMYAYDSSETVDVITYSMTQIVGSCILYCGLALALFYLGWRLIQKRTVGKYTTLIVLLSAAALLIIGYAVVLAGMDWSQMAGILEGYGYAGGSGGPELPAAVLPFRPAFAG